MAPMKDSWGAVAMILGTSLDNTCNVNPLCKSAPFLPKGRGATISETLEQSWLGKYPINDEKKTREEQDDYSMILSAGAPEKGPPLEAEVEAPITWLDGLTRWKAKKQWTFCENYRKWLKANSA